MKLPYKEFKKIYSIIPRLTVELVFISNNRILLLKRNIQPYKDYWYFPGGTLLYGEKVNDCILRVAKEELDIFLNNYRFFMYQPYYHEKRYGGFAWTVSLVFISDIQNNRIKLNYQNNEMKFFTKTPFKTIPEHKMIFNSILSLKR